MLIIKNTSKTNGKNYISIIVNADSVKPCKNEKFVKISLPEDFQIGTADNTKLLAKDIFKDIKVSK